MMELNLNDHSAINSFSLSNIEEKDTLIDSIENNKNYTKFDKSIYLFKCIIMTIYLANL